MNQRVLIRSLALLSVTMLGIAVFMLFQARKPAGFVEPTYELQEQPNPYAGFSIPEFRLTDRNNRPIDQTVLDHRFTVVDFFFTNCPLYCPVMTSEMRRVQEATKGSDLQLLSISIDGENDTPERIDGYAKAFDAEPGRWRFATGDPEAVADLVLNGLKFHIRGRAATLAAGETQLEHPTKLILIGPDRTVIGLYTYNNPEEIDELIATARRLVAKPVP